jgi:superfamily I DNA/RNA helicase
MAKLIEGPAGAGKTKRLIELVAETTAATPLKPHQAVLGLTFMHGSRRRMHSRLSGIISTRSGLSCATFDSFARTILQRWSPLARKVRPESVFKVQDFNENCAFAGELLETSAVSSWVTARFPLVVVDEAQDLDEHRLKMLKALAQKAIVFAAADEFQDLTATLPNIAVNWLQANSAIEPLSTVHRTKCQALLAASFAVREGSMPQTGKGFQIECVPTSNLAAWHIGMAIRKSGPDTVAVLSPSNAQFTRSALERLACSPLGKKVKVGPYSVAWEQVDREEAQAVFTDLGLSSDCPLPQLQSMLKSGTVYHAQLLSWVRRLSVYGTDQTISGQQVLEKIEELVHFKRCFHVGEEKKIAGMTIHQAKNREFGTVILLWPQIGTKWSVAQQRRLLYNGVTRAKNSCVVIVHDPKSTGRLEALFNRQAN